MKTKTTTWTAMASRMLCLLLCSLSYSSHALLELQNNQASQVPRLWTPENNGLVYVGHPQQETLNAERRKAFDAWAKTTRPEDVFLIVERAYGESYTSSGRTYQNDEAVLYMVADLMNQPKFKALTKEGLPARSVYTLILDPEGSPVPRQAAFHSSEYLDSYGFSNEAIWDEGTTKPYYDTLSHYINNGNQIEQGYAQATKQIADDLQVLVDARANELERKRKLASGEISQAEGLIQALQRNLTLFKEAHPKAAGDITRVDFATLQALLDSAKQALSRSAFEEVARNCKEITEKTGAYLDTFRKYIEYFPNRIAELRNQLAVVAASEQLAEPLHRESITNAYNALDKVERAYEAGDLSGDGGYPALIAQVTDSITALEDIEKSAITGAKAQLWLHVFALIVLGSAFFCILLYFLDKTKKVRQRATNEYQWQKTWLEEQHKLLTQLEQEFGLFGSGAGVLAFSKETRQMAEMTLDEFREAWSYWKIAHDVCKRVEKRIASVSGLGYHLVSATFDEAQQLFTKRLTFSRETAGLSLLQTANESSPYAALWAADLSKFKDIDATFKELQRKFAALTRCAHDRIQTIKRDMQDIAKWESATDETIDALASRQAAVATALQEAFGEEAHIDALAAAIPAFQRELDELVDSAKMNPVGCREGVSTLAARVGVVGEIIDDIQWALQNIASELSQGAEELQTRKFDSTWITAASLEIVSNADTRIGTLATSSEANSTSSVRAQFETLRNKVIEALGCAHKLTDLGELIPVTEKTIDAARQAIAAATSASTFDALAENGNEVTPRMQEATTMFVTAKTLLSTAEVEQVQRLNKKITAIFEEVTKICKSSVSAAQKFSEQRTLVESRIKGVNNRIDAHRAILDTIRRSYAATVLKLDTDDIVREGANGTLDDNISETEIALAKATAISASAKQAFGKAAVLEAMELLADAEEEIEFAKLRLQEIVDKKTLLEATMAANKERSDAAIRERDRCSGIARESETTQKSVELFDAQVSNAFSELNSLSSGQQVDPLAIKHAIDACEEQLQTFLAAAKRDRAQHAECVRSVLQAESLLQSVSTKIYRRRDVTIGKSDELERLIAQFQDARTSIDSLGSALCQPHSDWYKLNDQISSRYQELVQIEVSVGRELQLAQEAIKAIEDATNARKAARRKDFDYGITLQGDCGQSHIETAIWQLQHGNYQSAESGARSAISEIETAIATAERKERAEKKRRQKAAERLTDAFSQSTSRSMPRANHGGSSRTVSRSRHGGSSRTVSRQSHGGSSRRL